jgi:hypothetical protein
MFKELCRLQKLQLASKHTFFMHLLCADLVSEPYVAVPTNASPTTIESMEDFLISKHKQWSQWRLDMIVFIACLLESFDLDAMLFILASNADRDSMSAPAEYEAQQRDTSVSKPCSSQLGRPPNPRRGQVLDTAGRVGRRDSLSDLSLVKDFDCTILEQLLGTWLSAIDLVDYCPSTVVSVDSVEYIATEICRACSKIFSILHKIGGESFYMLLHSSRLQQEIVAVLLRYFSNAIHCSLLQVMNDSDFRSLLGAFFEVCE